jgi:DNA-binding NtrC family response regulator
MVERSILLIDDEEIILKSMNNILAQEGYKVTLADSGEKGLGLFEKGEYHLVITDLVMSGSDGINVIKQVKQTRPETMMLMITGCGETQRTVQAMSEGADDYILKPCKRDELIQKVADCFAKLERK